MWHSSSSSPGHGQPPRATQSFFLLYYFALHLMVVPLVITSWGHVNNGRSPDWVQWRRECPHDGISDTLSFPINYYALLFGSHSNTQIWFLSASTLYFCFTRRMAADERRAWHGGPRRCVKPVRLRYRWSYRCNRYHRQAPDHKPPHRKNPTGRWSNILIRPPREEDLSAAV